jgi:hypothetical protein
MTKILISVSVALLLVATQSAAQGSKTVTVSNPSPFVRPDELLLFKRADIEKKIGRISSFIGVKAKGKDLAVQYDDLDGDGKWDEAVMLYSFAPKESVSFAISQSKKENNPAVVQQAHVRLRKKNADDSWGPNITREEMPLRNPATDFSKQPLPLYLTEGPAWENNKVGFRLYFDVRNGKDIWGKRTSRMVLDSVGTKVEPSYHDLQEWGMDVLHAGKSLGAGSLAFLVPLDSERDTLIRLGGKDVLRTTYQQLADGPLRALFQITYDWTINGKPVQVMEQTSIWGGQYFYESRVWVKGAPQDTKLVSGIANFYENVFKAYNTGNTNVLFSYGAQSENKDNLGMAVLIPSPSFSFAGSAPHAASEILDSYLAAQDINEKEPCLFRFVAAWEKSDERFSKLKSFQNFLSNEAQKMSEPVSVRW